MAAYDVVKLEEAKQSIPVDGESGNEALARLISAVTLELESRLQTQFIQRSLVEYREGGVKRLYPGRPPLVEITSIQDPAGTLVPVADYTIRQKRWIEHVGTFPIAYVASTAQPTDWTITYISGWFATQSAVTPDVKNEVIRALSSLMSGATGGAGGDPNVSSVSVGDLSISYGGSSTATTGSMIAGSPALAAATDALFAYRGAFL